MPKPTADEMTIVEMHTYMRPDGSATEQAFVDRFLTPLGFERDNYRNLVLQIGDNPNILWSSHLDTVHRKEGRQTLHYDGRILQLSNRSKRHGSSCLGAGCTAGIWLMTEMVKAGVEGVYVIHHAEESGCIGSGDLASSNPSFFEGIEAAIAFDRYGYTSVITHQSSGKTASDAFATSLAAILGDDFEPDSGGVYTDTNEYAGLVSECTNISVGYHRQHTQSETQDVLFLIDLRNTLITADFSTLVFERKPGDMGDLRSRWGRSSFGRSSFGRYGGYGSMLGDSDDDDRRSLSKYDGLEGYVRAYPKVTAQLLESYGISETEFRANLIDLYGELDDDPEEREQLLFCA